MNRDPAPYRSFRVPFDRLTLCGDMLSEDGAADVLTLHGAGETGRQRVRYLRERLLAEGISSCCFDFIGHGETGGDIKNTSLLERTQQACRIIDTRNIRRPLRIIAASMGAYTAVKLLEHYAVEKLVLLVPAMYAADAYRVTFGNGFTDIIRAPNSWMNSDAWEILSTYTGDLFIIAAGRDEVIPKGVIDRIRASAVRARTLMLFTAPDAPHFVFTYLRSNASSEFEQVFERMVHLLTA